jgi:uncharacterized protein (TIGR01777 family)
MRIIIAGGSGMIGRAMTSSLVDDGNEVIILSRRPRIVMNLPNGVKVLEWDGISDNGWGKEMENTDVVIHLAGENLSGAGLLPLRWTEERKNRLLQSRVNTGKILSKAIEMAERRPTIFIQASGIGFYGTERGCIFSEDSMPGNDYLANLSQLWEASSKSVDAIGVRRVIIRTGVVLSSQGGALRPLVFPYKLYIGGPIGDGNQVLSWIHIDDEVNAIRFLISNHQASGVYNLTSPNPVTNNEFGKTISKVLRKPHYLPIPGFLMRLALGEVADMVLEGQTVLPRILLESGFIYKYPTLDDALQNLL